MMFNRGTKGAQETSPAFSLDAGFLEVKQCWLLCLSSGCLYLWLLPLLASGFSLPDPGPCPVYPLFKALQVPHLLGLQLVHGDILGHLALPPPAVGLGGDIEVDLSPVAVNGGGQASSLVLYY